MEIKFQSLVAKAKRRIRKYIETQVHQPRTYSVSPTVFRYRVKHDKPELDLFFELREHNRLRRLANSLQASAGEQE